MYNRYVGNTGKVYIVENPRHSEPNPPNAAAGRSPEARQVKLPGLLNGLLPSCFETTDLLIIGLLLFLFFESRDTDFLVILGFFAWSVFSDR